ncbi:MAG TPA: sulfatase-like hydrolase/transferase [Phycisphaerae bacterium]|nr:sulfatase-like hydrolase/transferase [Phycisphaerae bacterium]
MNRREFLHRTLMGAVALAAGDTLLRAAPRKPLPNILLILSDEHNAGVAGPYGNAIVQTPSLDALSRRGVTFDSAYTSSPLCVPARLSITAGKYASRVGAWGNSSWLRSDDIASLPRMMTALGYDSYLCGKMHYDPTRGYGFQEIGAQRNQYFKTGLGTRRRADDMTVNWARGKARFSTFHLGNTSEVLSHDAIVTLNTRKFLALRKRGGRPFFLVAGYLAPHFPLVVPREYWQPYYGKVPAPKLPPGHLAGQPLNYQHLRRGFGTVNASPTIVQSGRELYYGLTQWMDGEVGKVLDVLAGSEFAGNTVVIYASDHGENMGEHGLWWKNCMYDHAARVPLIVSWPQRWKGGQRRSGVCSLLDVVQTIVALGGGKCPGDWDGDSMLGYLDDPQAPWKNFAVSEYYGHNVASGFTMIRSGRHKYVYHIAPDEQHPAERELYDLQTDPGEFTNLAGLAEHQQRVALLHTTMVKELGEDPSETEKRCRAEMAKGYGRQPPPPPVVDSPAATRAAPP